MSALSRTFPKSLYVLPAVNEAIQVYEGLATMTLERSDDAWTVIFTETDADFEPEVIASEFANYVLAETINRRR